MDSGGFSPPLGIPLISRTNWATARGSNPAVVFSNPQVGLYDIWIGSYDGSRRNPGRLIVTEFNY